MTRRNIRTIAITLFILALVALPTLVVVAGWISGGGD
jgi:hypothetical protein